MAAQSCIFSTNVNAEKEPNFLGKNLSIWFWHLMLNKFSGNSDSDKKPSWLYWTELRGLLQPIGPVPKINTTVASSSYTKCTSPLVAVSKTCGKLIRVAQDCPVQSPPFISNLLWQHFAVPHTLTFTVFVTAYSALHFTVFVTACLLAMNTSYV